MPSRPAARPPASLRIVRTRRYAAPDLTAVDTGSEFAGYRILRELGRGGMGLVYEAEHLRLGRKAAIKLLAPDLSRDEAHRDRFVQESRVLAAIEHPSLIPIYDAGEIDGLLYIAMRYVDGTDLAKLLAAEGAFELERALAMLDQVGSALDAAHARDLVHRDVKPANVLIDAADGRVFLSDFGLVTRARTAEAASAGLFAGTVGYVAPEQIEGRSVSPATDVYALGCILYECVTGRQPFEGELEIAVLYAHLRDTPRAVSAARPELPSALDAVLAKALAKLEDDRFPSCGALLAAARAAVGPTAPIVRAAPASAPVRTDARPARRETNVPVPVSSIVGREREQEKVQQLLRRPGVRLLTLVGAGGVGKTRLALEVATVAAAEFRSVYFVALDSVTDPLHALATIAETVGVDDHADAVASVVEALSVSLAQEEVLLVLDNVERVPSLGPPLAELLAAAPLVKSLVTSRAPLHLAGEHEYVVNPLAVPQPEDVAEISRSPAVTLFVERATARDPSFELDDTNTAAVAEICARLDGLPLAIELAAAHVKVLPPQAMLARLENTLELLTDSGRDRPSRHRTLRGAIDWSYQLLDRSEQVLLARLAVFVDGWTIEAAEAVCGGDSRSLLESTASLLNRSLVVRRAGADDQRFGLFQTIREYALSRLAERGELDELRRRHAEYFLRLAEEAEPELVGTDQAHWVRRLDAETGNLRAALAWSLERGSLEVGLRTAGALMRLWSVRGQFEGRSWLEQALTRVGDEIPAAVRAKALFASGYAALGQGDHAEAQKRFEESLQAYDEVEDRGGRSRTLAQLGWLAMTRGHLERATTMSQESLALARELGDDRTASVALANLADTAAALGDEDQAAGLFEESLSLRVRSGDRRNVANALLNLGRIELARGNVEHALELLAEGRELALELGDTWGASVGAASLARVALQGDLPRARALLTEGLELARRRGDKKLAAECLETAAALAAAQAEAARAARALGSADGLRASAGITPSRSDTVFRERIAETARTALGAETLARELEAGRRIGLDDAVAAVLDTLARGDPSET